jgi:hypothetical protein
VKYSTFTGQCPYEIGDVIKITIDNKVREGVITDICASHFVREGKIVFTYELDNEGKYYRFHSFSEYQEMNKENVREKSAKNDAGEEFNSKVVELRRKE